MNSSLGLAEKQNNKKEEKETDNGGEEDVNEPITVNDKTLEDATHLKENPKVMKLLLSIEDMMENYRTVNVDSMNANNKVFHQATDKMVNTYFTTTKTERMYKRYQDMWVRYAQKKNINKKTLKDSLNVYLLALFIQLGKDYAPRTFYAIYSCINHHFITKNGYELNTMLRLQRFLKLNTSTYVCKKSKVSRLIFCSSIAVSPRNLVRL